VESGTKLTSKQSRKRMSTEQAARSQARRASAGQDLSWSDNRRHRHLCRLLRHATDFPPMQPRYCVRRQRTSPLVTSDRTDVACVSQKASGLLFAGFLLRLSIGRADEQNKLAPFYTVDRHQYLNSGSLS